MNLTALIDFVAALQSVFLTTARGPLPAKLREFRFKQNKVGFLIVLRYHSHVANESESPI